jgi:hypothetical protein
MTADLHPRAGTHATFSGLAVVGVELVKALAANRQAVTFPLLGSGVGVARGVLPQLLEGGTAARPARHRRPYRVLGVDVARYVAERARGRTQDEAVNVGAARIGRAFVASG